ncbi:MAG: TIGR00341 family protein [Patescibacteria group bacterium]|nr:TIGR00341 family protein [Patescibacteria group bacterium]
MEIIDKNKKHIKKCIGPFYIDGNRQKKVYHEIKESAKGDFDFFVLIIFSGIIITLGLVVDSSAVVIGGMLLAPLVWPILALSLGIVKGRSKLIQDSAFTLLKSTLLIFVIAIIIGIISPSYALKGTEFLSRTSPTIFELFIALAAGFVGAFVIAYPKIGAAIAGVVVAAALVPPIAVMGVSIAHGDVALAGGAFILYLSNLIAVTFSASVLFFIARFKGPSSEKGQERMKSNMRWTLLFLLVLAVPLFLITSNTIKENKQQKIVREIISVTIPEAVVTNVSIDDKSEVLITNITIQYSENLTGSQISDLESVLSKGMNKEVVSRITVVPITKMWE